MIKWSTTAVAGLLALTVSAPPAGAQFFAQPGSSTASAGNIEGFTVTGKGSASAKPNRLEIDLEVSASSELTADAIVKYRDTKRRLQEAFAALKLDNVSVEERGLVVDQKGAQFNPYMFDGSVSRKAKAEVQLSRKLVVKCSNIRAMDEEAILQLVARLLDVAQDAGGKVGGTQENFNPYYGYRFNQPGGNLVRFVLDDYDRQEQEAYDKAIADAEGKARRLARLGRVNLGGVTAIREAVTPGGNSTNQDDEGAPKRLESSRFQEIAVRVELVVRFDVTPRPADGRPADK